MGIPHRDSPRSNFRAQKLVLSPLYLSDLNQTWHVSTNFSKTHRHQNLWRSFRLVSSCYMRKNGQTNMARLTDLFFCSFWILTQLKAKSSGRVRRATNSKDQSKQDSRACQTLLLSFVWHEWGMTQFTLFHVPVSLDTPAIKCTQNCIQSLIGP
jgi:hypothetical protein